MYFLFARVVFVFALERGRGGGGECIGLLGLCRCSTVNAVEVLPAAAAEVQVGWRGRMLSHICENGRGVVVMLQLW